LLTPVDENHGSFSQIIETKCFNSFSESIYAATRGRVQLDSSIRPEDVTEGVLDADDEGDKLTALQVVIGIDWDYENFSSSSYTWVVISSGCSSTVRYRVSSMPSGWDNRVSSARAYSNCNNFYHYQDTNHEGSSMVCNTTGCSTMGSLNNAEGVYKLPKFGLILDKR
jgi:hypothetical protein